MTQEEKQFLLKDLCARLPYDFYIKEEYGDYVHITLYSANIEHLIDRVIDGLDKLVLRSMSSMTEVEYKEYMSISDKVTNPNVTEESDMALLELIDFLNSHHLDYRGLIEKGLAIEVTEENNPYKE